MSLESVESCARLGRIITRCATGQKKPLDGILQQSSGGPSMALCFNPHSTCAIKSTRRERAWKNHY